MQKHAIMNNLNASSLLDAAICWCLWLFGMVLKEVQSLKLHCTTFDSLSLVDFSLVGDVVFQTLQITSFIVAIIVGIVNLLKTFGFNVNLKKRWSKKS